MANNEHDEKENNKKEKDNETNRPLKDYSLMQDMINICRFEKLESVVQPLVYRLLNYIYRLFRK